MLKIIIEKRLTRSKGLLARLATQPVDQIVFSDDKLFTIEEATSKQNDRILALKYSSISEKHLYVKRTQKPQSVMVWAGISAKGRTPLIFVPPEVKINSSTYQQLILDPVVKDLSKTMFNKEPFLFQQDGAPAHTSNVSQNWLRKNVPDFISKEEWPPSSPDLTFSPAPSIGDGLCHDRRATSVCSLLEILLDQIAPNLGHYIPYMVEI